jgi:hypothetical protein
MEIKSKCETIYAPILIPTLCRDEHFIRCIESLKKNTWACYTDVYVGLDYPKKKSHWDGYNKICKYLEGDFSIFKNFYIVKREYNYGPAKNIYNLREEIYKKYDRFIRTDDDAQFSVNLLEYMNKCLIQYKDNENVLAVTGYSYPVTWKVSKDSNILMQNYICPMWGTGFWVEKFKNMEKEIVNGYLIENFDSFLKSKLIYQLTDARFVDYVSCYLRNNNELINCVTDISVGMYLLFKSKYIVAPKISKVRNYGFDGTGVYCQNIPDNSKGNNATDYNYKYQPIDEQLSFNINTDTENQFIENKSILNKFDCRSCKIMYRLKFELLLYKILGRKLWFKLLKFAKKLKTI